MQKGRTTSMELDEYLKNKNGTYEISISKQAFSKQRKNLKPQVFIDIYKDYLIDFYHNYPEEVNTFNVLQDIKNTNTRRIQEKQINKNLKYKYKVNINILAGWLKNILIAVMFTEDGEEQEKLYNIIVEKAERNLVAIKPNRTNVRKPYTSRRNKYRINLRNNM